MPACLKCREPVSHDNPPKPSRERPLDLVRNDLCSRDVKALSSGRLTSVLGRIKRHVFDTAGILLTTN